MFSPASALWPVVVICHCTVMFSLLPCPSMVGLSLLSDCVSVSVGAPPLCHPTAVTLAVPLGGCPLEAVPACPSSSQPNWGHMSADLCWWGALGTVMTTPLSPHSS